MKEKVKWAHSEVIFPYDGGTISTAIAAAETTAPTAIIGRRRP